MEMLYYGTTDFKVSEFRHRSVMDEIRMVITAFECVIPDNTGLYCSSDVTTGRRLYGVFRKYGVHSVGELEAKLGESQRSEVIEKVIRGNIERGIEFTENIRQRGLINLINPGPFTARGFEQEHYYYLWESVVIKKVCEMWLNEGWEYSNGCTLEYAIAARKGIPRRDHLGNILELPQAIHMAEQAIAELRRDGMDIVILERNLARMRELRLSYTASLS